VYYAGSQVWIIGGLSESDQVKAWIRGARKSMTEWEIGDLKALDEKELFRIPLKNILPAPSSVLTISAPRLLLSPALKFLLIGLGIYLSFLWKKHVKVSEGVNDNRNVFIVYLAGLVLCYGVYTAAGINQYRMTSATVRKTIRNILFNRKDRKGKEKMESSHEHENNGHALNQGLLQSLHMKIEYFLDKHREKEGYMQHEREQRRGEEVRERLRKEQERQERQGLERRVRILEQQLLDARSAQAKREWALVKINPDTQEVKSI